MPYETIGNYIFSSRDIIDDEFELNYCHSLSYTRDKYFYLTKSNYRKNVLSEDFEKNSILENHFHKTDQLGTLESLLLKKMIYCDGRYINIVIGAIGSGKTALMNFISNHYTNNYKFKHESYWLKPIRVNFNSIGNFIEFEKEQDYFDAVYKLIAEKIKYVITTKYVKGAFVEFWKKAVHYSSQYEKFSLVYNISSEFKNEQELYTLSNLSSHLKNEYSPYFRFRFWMHLLAIESVLTNSSVGSLIFLDNIDQHATLLQNKILKTFQTICTETKKIQVFIAMRVISFGNTWGDIKKPYIIPNCANLPMDIAKDRIMQVLTELGENNPQINAIKNMNNSQKRVLFILLLELYYLLSNKESNSKLNSVLTSIAGLSIRRGLTLCEHIFEQKSTPFDRTSSIRTYIKENYLSHEIDESMKSLVLSNIDKESKKYFYSVRDIDNNLFYKKDTILTNLIFFKTYFQAQEDKIIENIFTNGEAKLSLIKLRILDYLKNRRKTTFVKLREYINNYSFPVDDFILALNSLAHQNRKLIFFDGPIEIRSSEALFELDKKEIILTNSGYGYVNSVVKLYEYLQHCIFEFDSTLNRESSGIDKIIQIFKSIKELIDEDIRMTTNILSLKKEKLNNRSFKKVYCRLISLDYLGPFFTKSVIDSFRKSYLNHSTLKVNEFKVDFESFSNLIEIETGESYFKSYKNVIQGYVKFADLIIKRETVKNIR